MLLEMRDVVVRYGKATALQGVSMDIPQDEIVTLIGSNGAGKTTTLRAISGLNIPNSGEIRFQGRLINGVEPRNRAHGDCSRAGGPEVFGPMTVEERVGGLPAQGSMGMAQDFDRMYESPG
jgi:branched-chain amino acid transport system ATP-binding protein